MKKMPGKKILWWWLVLILVVANEAFLPEPSLKYHAYISPWTPCEESSSTQSLSEDLVFTPRLGTQMRVIMCRDNQGRRADNYYCSKAHNHVQLIRTCIVPEDCKLGNMTDWLPRSDTELIKYREIIKLPHGGGASCGQVQIVKTAQTVPNSGWLEGPWSNCLAFPRAPNTFVDSYQHIIKYQFSHLMKDWNITKCGGGTKKRVVVCVDINGEPLLDSQCEFAPPSSEEPCEVPCPRDCKVGEWGDWSPCSLNKEYTNSKCRKNPESRQSPEWIEVDAGISIRHRRVIEAPTELGVPCPHVEEARNCYRVFCHNCMSSPWRECLSNNKICGKGTRTREIQCTSSMRVEMWEHDNITNPPVTQECYVPCRGDHVLSQWSPWSKCSDRCMPYPLSKIPELPVRMRYKHYLSFALNDKEPESSIAATEKEPCNDHSCTTYSWQSTAWGPCMILDYNEKEFYIYDKICYKEGMRYRTVHCVKDNSEIVDDDYCQLRKPVTTSTCKALCDPDFCLSGPWSIITPCPLGCDTYHLESVRSAIYPNEVPECLPNVKRKTCPKYPSCNNQEVRWYTGSWSSCVVPPDYPCGFGFRIRSVWCGTAEYEKLNPSYCAGTVIPETSIRCYNNDSCDMNHSLKSCATICQDPLKYMDIYDSQTAVCDCKNVDIRSSSLSSCILYPTEDECGKGYRIVASYCVVNNTHVPMEVCKKFHPQESQVYSDVYPDWLIEPCVVPCPVDCEYGPWGQWEPCHRVDNTRSAIRTRRRNGTYHNGRPCSLTEQTLNCTDIRPRWKVGEWQSCSPKVNFCGKKIINRTVNCVDHFGIMLPHKYCLDFDPMPETTTSCHAACPQDCLTSAWSEWSTCEMCSWGYKRRDRTRVVLRDRIAELNGKECGHLVESSRCTTDTYNWYYGPWTDCVPLGTSDCGEGIKFRDARCIKNNEEFVKDSFCNGTKTSETSWCYRECGIDCQVFAWSGWNKSDCTCGNHYTGEMIRYRREKVSAKWPGRMCPNLKEMAPCPRIPCAGAMISASDKCIIADESDNKGDVQICGAGTMTLTNLCKVYPNKDITRTLELPLKWCHKSPSENLTTVPLRQIEEECAIACKCNEDSPTLTPWTQWSKCNGFVRSRKRTLLPADSDVCHKTELQLSVEWTTCSSNKDELNYKEGAAHTILWVSAFFIMLYSMYYMFRFILMYHRKRNDKKPASV